MNTYKSIIKDNVHTGTYMVGYVKPSLDDEDVFIDELPCLGQIDDLSDIVQKYDIEELIIAVQNGHRKHIETIITMLGDIHDRKIDLKLIPQSQDFLVGLVKTSSVLVEPLISISPAYLPEWQRYTKRLLDILFSLLAIILLLPVYIFSYRHKTFFTGPILYSQERIGYRGKPFKILKFRSMYADAEQGVPQLSSKEDKRITLFGRFMRKVRLDETPQFLTFYLATCQLSDRSERQYYIDQIVKSSLLQVIVKYKPGITSMGASEIGYAENVDQMVERLKWDILYLENMSIQMDIKILIYTFLIVLKEKGHRMYVFSNKNVFLQSNFWRM